jgi:hypothetical protein
MRVKNSTTNLVFYLFADQLGSTNVTIIPRFWGERPERADTVPAVGAGVVSLSLYMPWGGSRGGAGTTLTDYGFTGQRRNSYIMVARCGTRLQAFSRQAEYLYSVNRNVISFY